ncbi:hypothetical protein [Corynebacterium mayonis]|uniref:hypothetical protein n=1 Tax=Corynebacterium mayonis TaxID=3062461 RepID=UPI0031403241
MSNSVESFNSKELNAYLSSSSHGGNWGQVSEALEKRNDQQIKDALIKAQLHELFQLQGNTTDATALESRTAEVKNAVSKQLTKGRWSAVAKAVLKGLSTLETADPKYRPSSPSFWFWYFPQLSALEEQSVASTVQEIYEHYSRIGAVDHEDLMQRLEGTGLSAASKQKVLNSLQPEKVRLVATLQPQLMRRIEATSVSNVVELIRPQAWVDNPHLKYSAYEAAPEGAPPVAVSELQAARAFFDARQKQPEKEAVSLIESSVATDKELRDLVLAFHIVKVREARHTSFPGRIIDEFQAAGLKTSEGDRLRGTGGMLSAVESAEQKRNRIADKLAFELNLITKLKNEGRVFAAKERFDQLDLYELQSSQVAMNLHHELEQRCNAANICRSEANGALHAKNFIGWVNKTNQGLEFAADMQQLQDWKQMFPIYANKQETMDSAMQRIQFVQLPIPQQQDSATRSRAGFIKKIVVPLTILDLIVKLPSPTHSLPGALTMALLLLPLVFLAYDFAGKHRIKTGKTKLPVVVGIIGTAFLWGNGLFFAGLAGIGFSLFYSRLIASTIHSKKIEAWNAFIWKIRENTMNFGLLNETAGVYRIRQDDVPERIFPAILHNEVSPDSVAAVPGDLLLVDGNGGTIERLESQNRPANNELPPLN